MGKGIPLAVMVAVTAGGSEQREKKRKNESVWGKNEIVWQEKQKQPTLRRNRESLEWSKEKT